MFVENLSSKIDFIARPGLKLRSGDFILVRVLKRLYGNKWAIGVKGRVISARTELDLYPGQLVRARVFRNDNYIVLKLENSIDDPIVKLANSVGINLDKDTRIIVESILRSNLPVTKNIISLIKSKLKDFKGNKIKAARLLAILIDKGLNLNDESIEMLLEVMGNSGKDTNHRNDGMQEKNDKKDSSNSSDTETEESKKIALKLKEQLLRKSETGNHSLQLFNHISGKHDFWIILPFFVNYKEHETTGVVKLNYERFKKLPKRIIVTINLIEGEVSFKIDVTNHGITEKIKKNDQVSKYRMSIFTENEKLKGKIKRKLDIFKLKLRNHDIEIDDTIFESDDFDGFSPLWELPNYQAIDTMG